MNVDDIERDWQLYTDWCKAVRRRPVPADTDTIHSFAAAIPAAPGTLRRRMRTVAAAHRTLGYPAPGATRNPRQAQRYDPAAVAAALSAATIGGWPDGIVGRRDAALVAAICTAGLTRNQARRLTAGPGALRGVTVRVADPPGQCPACAFSRWLRVRAAIAAAGWRHTRAQLADLGEITADTAAFHDCDRPVPWNAPAGQPGPLFVAIDRHGGLELLSPLSSRSITSIVARRLAQTEPRPAAADPGTATAALPWRPRTGDEIVEAYARRIALNDRLAELDELLGEAERSADELLARLHLD